MSLSNSKLRLQIHLGALAIALLCATLVGCIGATPLPKRTRTPQGIEEKTVDLGFIQPGKTTRAEVKESLKLIDTGYQNDRFFLGRWSSSSSGGWVFLVGYGGGIGNADRFWRSGNLLVEFDDAGIVRRSETFSDSHLVKELTAVADASPIANSDKERVELPVTYGKAGYAMTSPANIALSASTFEFEELGTAKKRDKFAVPARDVIKLQTSIYGRPDPVHTNQTIYFAHDLKQLGGPGGKKINLEITVPQLVTLMSYVSHRTQAAPVNNKQ